MRRALSAGCLAALLSACGGGGPEPVEPLQTAGLEQDVLELVQAKIAAVRHDRSSARAYLELALVYEANAMWEEAQLAYAAALEVAPGDHLARFHRGIALKQVGRAAEGLALIEEVARALPNDLAVQHRLGVELLEVDRIGEAARAFRRVADGAPGIPQGHHGLGEVALAEGNAARALEHLQKALGLAPNDQMVQFSLGRAFRDVGRTEEAKRFLTLGAGAQRQYIGDARTTELSAYAVGSLGRLNRAAELMNMGDNAGAVRILGPLRASRPTDTAVLNNLGAAYIGTREYEQASEAFRALLDLDPASHAAHYNLVTCSLALNDVDAALEHGRRAVALAPHVASMHLKYAEALSAARSFEATYGNLLEALRLGAQGATIHVALAETSRNRGNVSEAIRHYRNALGVQPNLVVAHGALCTLLASEGRDDEALAALEALRAVAPDSQAVAKVEGYFRQRGLL
jgi:tetratricopeptide (TPR) repeat protein